MAASLKGVDIFEFLTTLGKNVLDDIAVGNVKGISKAHSPTEIQFVEDLEPDFANSFHRANRVSQHDLGGQVHVEHKRQCDDTSGDGWPAADSGWGTMGPSSGWDDDPKLDSGLAKWKDNDGWGSTQVSAPARKPRAVQNVKWNAKEGSGGCSSSGWDAADRGDSGCGTMHSCSGWDDVLNSDSGWVEGKDSDGWGTTRVSTPPTKLDQSIKWNEKECSGGFSSVGWDATERGGNGWGLEKVGLVNKQDTAKEDALCSDPSATTKSPGGWGNIQSAVKGAHLDNQWSVQNDGNKQHMTKEHASLDNGWATTESPAGWDGAHLVDTAAQSGAAGMDQVIENSQDMSMKKASSENGWGTTQSDGWGSTECNDGWRKNEGCNADIAGDELKDKGIQKVRSHATPGNNSNWGEFEGLGDGVNKRRRGQDDPAGSNLVPVGGDKGRSRNFEMSNSMDESNERRKGKFGPSGSNLVPLGVGRGRARAVANKGDSTSNPPRYHRPNESDKSFKQFKHGGEKSSLNDGWSPLGDDQLRGDWGSSKRSQNVGWEPLVNNQGDDGWGSSKHSSNDGWKPLGNEGGDDGWGFLSRATPSVNEDGWGGNVSGTMTLANKNGTASGWTANAGLINKDRRGGNTVGKQMNQLETSTNEKDGWGGNTHINTSANESGSGRKLASGWLGNAALLNEDGWGCNSKEKSKNGWGASINKDDGLGGNASSNTALPEENGSTRETASVCLGNGASNEDGWGGSLNGKSTIGWGASTNEEDGSGGNARGITSSASENGITRETASGWLCNAASANGDGKKGWGASTNEEDGWGGNAKGNLASVDENGKMRETASGLLFNAKLVNEDGWGGIVNEKSTDGWGATTIAEDGWAENPRGNASANENCSTRQTASGWLGNKDEDGWGGNSNGKSTDGWGASINEEDGWGGNARGNTASVNENGSTKQTASGWLGSEDESGWGGNSNGKIANGWGASASKDGWGSKQDAKMEFHNAKAGLSSQKRWPSSGNRSSAFVTNNFQRPGRPSFRKENCTYGMSSPQNRSGHSQQVRDLMCLPELSEVSELHKMMNRLLHHSEYKDGDRLKPEDEKEVLEKVLVHHPDKEAKLAGLDYLMISTHADHNARCFFVVHKDGSQTDFSYWKCLKSLIQTKFPELSKDFSAA